MSYQHGLSVVIGAWVYGMICGLGIAVSTVGFLRGEPLPGVIWPAMTPLLLAP